MPTEWDSVSLLEDVRACTYVTPLWPLEFLGEPEDIAAWGSLHRDSYSVRQSGVRLVMMCPRTHSVHGS